MKKIILIIALFISIINIANAQFTIGPKLGLNISKEYVGIEGIDETVDFKNGINAGIFGKYMMSDKFDIQAELLYSQQGYKCNIPLVDYGGIAITDGYKLSSHYLNIPLLLKYYPLERIYIEAGPQAGFCFSTKVSPIENKDDITLNRDYNTVVFLLVGGVGVDIGYGLSLNARYNHGLTHTLPNTTWKNRVIQISLLYDLWSF